MIQENLHNITGTAQTKKVLAKLVESDDLVLKEFGKVQIFWINQKVFPAVDDSQLKKLAMDIKNAQISSREAVARAASLRREAAGVESQLPTDELRERVAALEKSTAASASKLEKMRAGGTTVDRAAFDRASARLQRALKAWSTRKKTALEILGDLSEGSGKSMKDLKASIGIEDDAEAKVDLKAMNAKYATTTKRPAVGVGGAAKKRAIMRR
eukprot:TRINITY_DN5327_c0_g1_i1.p1 TRINITY_DN5327_c0_g1~~TRINITY_DN5327_c0_g1_i1.p1  ORF type:complete len:213 (-),score=98.45 TRINITY_DN5327_c0_g1_i1:112-750(-)